MLNIQFKSKVNQDVSEYINEDESELNDSQFKKKKEILQEASKQIDRDKINEKFSSNSENLIINQQQKKMKQIFNKEDNKMIKMEYYDTLLNMERKIDHFDKLIQKIKLRIIHKPFIILDMLKFMTDEENSLHSLSSLLTHLIKMKRRQSFDKIISFVENKKKIPYKWLSLIQMLQKKNLKETKAEIKVSQNKVLMDKRKHKMMNNSFKFLSSIMNNMIKERKTNYFNHIIMKMNSDRKHGHAKKASLGIENHSGFLMVKDEFQKHNSQFGTNNRYSNVPNENDEEDNHFQEDEHLNNYETYEIESINSNHLVQKRRGTGAQGMNIFLQSIAKGSQSVQFSFFDKDINLIDKIRTEIQDISNKINENKQSLSIEERIELLNRLTVIMNLLKKYYQEKEYTNEEDNKKQQKNFETVLQLVKKLMELLLKKMSDDISDSQIRLKRVKSNYESYNDEEIKKLESENRSLLRLGQLTRRLTQDLGRIGTHKNIDTNGQGDVFMGSRSIPFENSEVEFQSITAINNLLKDMVQNLNILNINDPKSNHLSIYNSRQQQYNFRKRAKQNISKIKTIKKTKIIKKNNSAKEHHRK